MRVYIISVIFITSAFVSTAQPSERRISKDDYINQWDDVAVQQMHEHGIPASITLAQGILESGNGNSKLARYANNHFGIKCHNWEGNGFYKDDDRKDECFRRYANASKSFEDHSQFISNRSRYASLFDLKTDDYKSWARGLRRAGYATNPRYAGLLIEIIEEKQLYKYDQQQYLKGAEPAPEPATVSSKQKSFAHYQMHNVRQHKNRIKCVKVKEGDTVYKIAEEFDMNMWQIYKYNDFADKQDILKVGSYVYLQPKRNRARRGNEYYAIKSQGKTLRKVSQVVGVKLKKLRSRNQEIDPKSEITLGTKVALR